MFNTAISALGKAQQVEAAAALFAACPAPDGVTFETMIAAYGMAGRAAEAEDAFQAMIGAGGRPRGAAGAGCGAGVGGRGVQGSSPPARPPAAPQRSHSLLPHRPAQASPHATTPTAA